MGIDPIASAASGIVSGVGGILDDLFTSDEERAKAEIAMARISQAPFLASLEIDKEEAKHASIFVAGARPFLKWVVGGGVAYEVLLRPLLTWLTNIANGLFDLAIVAPPSISLEELITLVTGGAALYGARAVEGVMGRKRNHV